MRRVGGGQGFYGECTYQTSFRVRYTKAPTTNTEKTDGDMTNRMRAGERLSNICIGTKMPVTVDGLLQYREGLIVVTETHVCRPLIYFDINTQAGGYVEHEPAFPRSLGLLRLQRYRSRIEFGHTSPVVFSCRRLNLWNVVQFAVPSVSLNRGSEGITPASPNKAPSCLMKHYLLASYVRFPPPTDTPVRLCVSPRNFAEKEDRLVTERLPTIILEGGGQQRRSPESLEIPHLHGATAHPPPTSVFTALPPCPGGGGRGGSPKAGAIF